MREIGSEFMMDSYIKGKNEYVSLVNYPKRYVLSGRTGLYLIAQELKCLGINSIALPTYCCSSMVMPFCDAQCQVSFYEEKEEPISEAILIMDYFGFLKKDTVPFARKCHEAGMKVIIDATQTAFSRAETYSLADFIVVSYRKWMDCLCAAVYSKNGFQTPEYIDENEMYMNTWREASWKKRQYIKTRKGDKQEFLKLYSKANHMLDKDYVGYRANDAEVERLENVDSLYLRESRRSNALILINYLSGRLDMLFERLDKEDCPLHVPIILSENNKKYLRTELIKEAIYCPCHWPIDDTYPNKRTELHDKEMSLICDQRYSSSDIEFEAKELLKIIEKKERKI